MNVIIIVINSSVKLDLFVYCSKILRTPVVCVIYPECTAVFSKQLNTADESVLKRITINTHSGQRVTTSHVVSTLVM